MTSLPTQTTPFVGRADELRDIAARLADPTCRLLTLVGPGGIGKTRLALEILQQANFPDGVHAVFLQPIESPELIVPAIANALHLQFYNASAPQQQLIDHLSEKTCLLLLDNFEHLLDGLEVLNEILIHAAGVKLLVTSRERLRLRDEWVIDVEGLNFPTSDTQAEIDTYSAVRLFTHHARRFNHNFSLADEPAVVARICALLGGSPLSLELAASWTHSLSCTQIAEELERGIEILKSSARDIPDRHRSMRMVLTYSWVRLSSSEQDVFKKLSVFRGSFTREAAEVVAGASLNILSNLIDTSWLSHRNGRYTLHELLRQFGDEQLQASGMAEAARDAHSAYYSQFLREKWTPLRSDKQVAALDAVDLEFENVRTAWHNMSQKVKAAELSASVYPLFYFCDMRGRAFEAIELFEQAERALRPVTGDPQADYALGQILTRHGFLMLALDQFQTALDLTEQGLALLEHIGSPVDDIVTGLTGLGLIYGRLNQPWVGKSYVERGIELSRYSQDDWVKANIISQLFDPYWNLNDMDAAQHAAEEHYRLACACGDLWLRAMALNSLSSLRVEAGDPAEGKKLLEQSLHLLEQVGQDCMLSTTHCKVGELEFRLGDYVSATRHYRQALIMLTGRKGYTFHILFALFPVAELFNELGNWERTVELAVVIEKTSTAYPTQQKRAVQILDQLHKKHASSSFDRAQQRGEMTEIQQLIRELIEALGEQTLFAVQQPVLHQLTNRELEVLHLVADGLSNAEIARQLHFTISTVKWYLSEIYSKLDAHNRAKAVAHAREKGLLT